MQLSISADCWNLGLRAGCVLFQGVRVGPSPEALREEIRQAAVDVRKRFAAAAEIRAVPEVRAFQELLRAVGASTKKFTPSLERLLTYAWKRGDLPNINSFVDAYNLVSVRSLCSLGAHDLDRIATPIALRMLTGEETFTPLGGSEPEPVRAGEYAYVDSSNRVLCRLDVLQAEFSKVTTQSTKVILIVEGTASFPPSQEQFQDAMDTIGRYYGGSAIWDGAPTRGV